MVNSTLSPPLPTAKLSASLVEVALTAICAPLILLSAVVKAIVAISSIAPVNEPVSGVMVNSLLEEL